MDQQQLDQMNSIRWFHRIELEPGLFTPGECPHTAALATSRFGMPEDLTGKTVLDIGSWDGLFSFEAEKRNALFVQAIDTVREKGGHWGGTDGFEFARKYLNSNVDYCNNSIHDFRNAMTEEEIEKDDQIGLMFDRTEDHSKDFDVRGGYDIVLFYGVLYHLTDPIAALKKVFNLTKEFALIETAYCKSDSQDCLWEYAPFREGDETNYWYPTYWGLLKTLASVGFNKERMEVIWQDDYRMTIKVYKQ